MPNRVILTKRRVDETECTKAGQTIVWDAKTAGFGLLVGKQTKSFILQRDAVIDGKRKAVRRTLGRAGAFGITVEDARKAAAELIAQLNKGVDPKHEKKKQAAAAEQQERERGMTLAEAVELYSKSSAKGRKGRPRAEKTQRATSRSCGRATCKAGCSARCAASRAKRRTTGTDR